MEKFIYLVKIILIILLMIFGFVTGYKLGDYIFSKWYIGVDDSYPLRVFLFLGKISTGGILSIWTAFVFKELLYKKSKFSKND